MTTYDFEGGSAGGTANPTNTGLSAVTAGSGNSIAFTSDAANGALGLAFVVGGTTSCWAEAAAESGAGTTESLLVAIRLSSDGYNNSGGSTTLWQKFLADNTTTVFRVSVTNAGALTVSDQGTAHTATLVADVTGRYGNWIFVRLNLDTGSSSATGVYTARYYTSFATAVGSPVASATASNWNIGAGGTFGKARFGINSGQASNGTDGRRTVVDYLVLSVGTSWIASPAAPTAPTANAGVDQYGQSGTTFSVSGSGTPGTSGGTITAYAWTFATKARPDMATPTIVSPSSQNTNITNVDPGWYDFNLVVTQSGGNLSSPANTVRLWVHPPPGVPVKPVLVTRATGITREGSATTDEIAISDSDLATLLRWPDSPAGEVLTVVWGPCGPSNPVLTVEGAKIGSDAITRNVKHYWEDGTTLLDGGPGGSGYTQTLGTQAAMAAGLSGSAITALGTALVDRRALVTKISDTA